MSGTEKLSQPFPKNALIGNQAYDFRFDYASGHQTALNKQLLATKQRYKLEEAHAQPLPTTGGNATQYGYSDEIEAMIAEKRNIEKNIAEMDRQLADKERKKIQQGKGRAERPFSMMPRSSR